MAIDRALTPFSDLNEATSEANLARLRFRQGNYAAAETGLRDAIERKQRLLGADYADNGSSNDRASLAQVLIARGRLGEAKGSVEDALTETRHRYRGAHPDTAFALAAQAEWLMASGEPERAATAAGDAVAMYTALDDRHSDKAIRAHLLYGDILQALGRGEEAALQIGTALKAANDIKPKAAALIALAEADLAQVDVSIGDRATADLLRTGARASLFDIPPGRNTDGDAATRLLANAKIATR